MKKFLKYGLIVLFAALTLVGITLLMNKVNSTEGTSNYYRSKYNENYNNAVAMLSDKNESLKNRYDAFMSVYKNTEEALTLKSKKDLTKEQKILTKIYTKEKLEKVIDDAFVALDNIKTTEEYNYNYGVNKNGASEPNFAEASSYIALYQEFESKVKDAEKYAAENTKKYTFLDGVIDSVFCISVVFAILIILWLIIECFKFIKPKKEQTPKLDAKEDTSKKIRMEDITDPDMMVAALTATIDYASTGARNVKLVNIKERK